MCAEREKPELLIWMELKFHFELIWLLLFEASCCTETPYMTRTEKALSLIYLWAKTVNEAQKKKKKTIIHPLIYLHKTRNYKLVQLVCVLFFTELHNLLCIH